MMKFAEPLIPILGEDLVKKLFGVTWNQRDEGLKELEDHVRANIREDNDQNNQAIYQASLTAVGHALDDKIAQVNQRGMSLL